MVVTKESRYYLVYSVLWLIYAPVSFISLLIALILMGAEPITITDTVIGLIELLGVISGYILLCIQTINKGKELKTKYWRQLSAGLVISLSITISLFLQMM